MRRFLNSMRQIFAVLAAGGCLLFFAVVFASPVFSRGDGYVLYKGSSSSPMVETQTPALSKFLLGGVNGESTQYKGDMYQAIKAEFCATLLWTEEAAGVTNYYLYSPRLSGGTMLNGYLVNLHIAVRENTTAVGTPLIFGGY